MSERVNALMKSRASPIAMIFNCVEPNAAHNQSIVKFIRAVAVAGAVEVEGLAKGSVENRWKVTSAQASLDELPRRPPDGPHEIEFTLLNVYLSQFDC